MAWEVCLSRKAEKQVTRLPGQVRDALILLMLEIEITGPVRGNWSNYSKLGDGRHHCHIKKGRPTYVAVWEEGERSARIVEVVYAGTHEKAPY